MLILLICSLTLVFIYQLLTFDFEQMATVIVISSQNRYYDIVIKLNTFCILNYILLRKSVLIIILGIMMGLLLIKDMLIMIIF